MPTVGLLGTLFVLLTSSAGAANILLNPSFELDDASASPFFLRAPDKPSFWLPVGDYADIIHNTYTQGPSVLVSAQDGSQFLDLNQALPALGGVRQEVSVTAGAFYQLSLWSTAWAINGTGQIRYSIYDPITTNVLASALFDATEDGIWHNLKLTAQATSNQLGVRIESTIFEQAGPGLDNVTLSAVPEPATMSLFAAAGLAAVFLRRKR